jgi:putative PEP-CTERM system histidine kinase
VADRAATTIPLYGVCAATYLLLLAIVLWQTLRGRGVSHTGWWLCLACLATAFWAAAAAVEWDAPMAGLAGQLDLFRAVAWYGFILHLYRRASPKNLEAQAMLGRAFTTMALVGLLSVIGAVLLGMPKVSGSISLWSGSIVIRLAVAVCQLLILENLYRNTPDEVRWNINLTCVALGGVAAFDVLTCGDAALSHRAAPTLIDGRALVATVAAPLLALAALRNRRWGADFHLSRTAAFHTATLVVCGVFLLAIAAAGELAQRTGSWLGPGWGGVAEIGLLFGGMMTIGVFVTSGSARGALRGLVVDHFFTSRYEYRREWMRCIETLSGGQADTPLHGRMIRTLAQVVDSPGGVLLLREPGEIGLHWGGSWNMPSLLAPVPPSHGLLRELAADKARELDRAVLAEPPLDGLSQAWLAVPLPEAGRLVGCVIVARPRAAFRLDREVFALLRIVAHEVATHLAEQRSARVLMETRELREYGQRFAFVAHDIKNVSSQLSLLLSNAETHIDNPAFQQDMLATVRASVAKIGGLIRRLQVSDDPLAGVDARATVALPERLEAVVAATARVRGAVIAVEQDGWRGEVAIAPAAFDTVLTHILDNAIEAGGQAAQVQVRLTGQGTPGAAQVAVDVIDTGPGMTPEFVRDELFRPFRTSKREGSGIGAFQARALLREAGGDLLVQSSPGGGTTMRLLLAAAVFSPAGGAVSMGKLSATAESC